MTIEHRMFGTMPLGTFLLYAGIGLAVITVIVLLGFILRGVNRAASNNQRR